MWPCGLLVRQFEAAAELAGGPAQSACARDCGAWLPVRGCLCVAAEWCTHSLRAPTRSQQLAANWQQTRTDRTQSAAHRRSSLVSRHNALARTTAAPQPPPRHRPPKLQLQTDCLLLREQSFSSEQASQPASQRPPFPSRQVISLSPLFAPLLLHSSFRSLLSVLCSRSRQAHSDRQARKAQPDRLPESLACQAEQRASSSGPLGTLASTCQQRRRTRPGRPEQSRSIRFRGWSIHVCVWLCPFGSFGSLFPSFSLSISLARRLLMKCSPGQSSGCVSAPSCSLLAVQRSLFSTRCLVLRAGQQTHNEGPLEMAANGALAEWWWPN